MKKVKVFAIIAGMLAAWAAVNVLIFVDCTRRYGVEQTAAETPGIEGSESGQETRLAAESSTKTSEKSSRASGAGDRESGLLYDYIMAKRMGEDTRIHERTMALIKGYYEAKEPTAEPEPTEIPGEEKETVREIGVNGQYLPGDLYKYLYQRLKERGYEKYTTYIICQMYQESRFNLNADNGLDKGLLQYRITFWDAKWAYYGFNFNYDIFNPYAQIELYIREFELRIAQGITKTISDHYTGGEGFSATYVNDVLHWMDLITYREVE